MLDERALHGVVGEFVKEADPFTEADRAAVLMSLLAAAGCAINSRPHVLAGNERHPTRISSS